jgi:hypothetical protein
VSRTSNKTFSRSALRAALGLAATFVAMFALTSPAWAGEGIEEFTTSSSTSAAGGHPTIETNIVLENPGSPEAAKDITVNTPAGVFGNPMAVTQCTAKQFAQQECSADSQVGLVTIRANYKGNPNFLLGTAPIYSLKTTPETTANLAFITPMLDIPINIPVTVRTAKEEDFGLRFTVSDITQLTPVASAHLTFWGFPAASEHNADRFPPGKFGEPAGCPGLEDTTCLPGKTASNISIQPLTDNPSACTGEELPTTLEVTTYQDLNHVSKAESSFPETTECENQTFKPLLYGGPTTQATDSASGLDIDLKDPQFLGFAVSPSDLKEASVTLPPGLTVNPDAADGQTACTDAEANFDTEGPAECPDQSKIGTISIHSLALQGSLEGSVYIGQPLPGNQYRLFMMTSGFGIYAKLVGTITPDPVTGQVTAHFENLPQAPFDEFKLHLFASDRGLMATPTTCSVYPLTASYVPWNSALPTVKTGFVFDTTTGPAGAPCPGEKRPFTPSLQAGTSNSSAGGFSAFTLKLDREDGDQYLGKLNFTMPPGLTADLRGISYCPEADILAAAQKLGHDEEMQPSCPAGSQIGTSNVAAGPGSHPFHAVGKMYLSGPFKGAPLSLAVITPALAGPYDYGTVVVRVALNIDPNDAHVVADSDVVPSIIGGIPLRLRSIQVNIDRPNFIINPTNCDPMSAESQGIGDEGTVANFSSYFHVDDCDILPFKPKMTIKLLGGRRSTKRSANPALQLDLNTRPGDANIKSLAVTLSNAFAIDQRHLGNICSEKELAEKQCAGRTPIGKASTTTPLLDQPLAGPVYAVSGSGGLPRLAFLLNGQVDLLPRAQTKTTSDGRLKTTVPVVPDAPIGHFHLVIFGGKHGYLANTRDLCRHAPLVRLEYIGQNERTSSESIKVNSPCGKSKARHKRAAP